MEYIIHSKHTTSLSSSYLLEAIIGFLGNSKIKEQLGGMFITLVEKRSWETATRINVLLFFHLWETLSHWTAFGFNDDRASHDNRFGRYERFIVGRVWQETIYVIPDSSFERYVSLFSRWRYGNLLLLSSTRQNIKL